MKMWNQDRTIHMPMPHLMERKMLSVKIFRYRLSIMKCCNICFFFTINVH